MNRYVRSVCLGLTIGCSTLVGCGEAEPVAPAKTDAPPPAAPEPTVKTRKGKQPADPKAEMGIAELREYRKQQRDSGKTP